MSVSKSFNEISKFYLELEINKNILIIYNNPSKVSFQSSHVLRFSL